MKIYTRWNRVLIILLATSLVGCMDMFGIALGVKPGDTISLVTATQNQVVLEYTHSYSFEFATTGRYADQKCSEYGKHAALVSSTRESVDRSIATFRCE